MRAPARRAQSQRREAATTSRLSAQKYTFSWLRHSLAVVSDTRALLAALVFEQEFAAQQAARIVRHALQPLLHGLLFFVLRAFLCVRAEADRLVFLCILLLLLQGFVHALREIFLRLRVGLVGTGLLLRLFVVAAVTLLAGGRTR